MRTTGDTKLMAEIERSEADRPLYQESGRPQFHFTAQRHSLNAPNGLVYLAGEYHLFFQHNPYGNSWGNMTWGHAVSTDLVHWRQRDNAIEPDRLGTIYSGSAVIDHRNTTGFQTGDEPPIVAMYTAAGGSSPESEGQPFTQCVAFSNDRGHTMTKYDRNPVLPHVVGENRDPRVVWYEPGGFWVMALFLDRESFALFSSPNMKRWTRLQTIALPGSSQCPDFFPITVDGTPGDERWVFTGANGRYLIGRFDGTAFTDVSGPFLMDSGANFYAGQTFNNIPTSDGRRIQVGWMAGGVYPGMPFNQQMSFPAELTLRPTSEGLRLFRYPVAEIAALTESAYQWGKRTVAPGENLLAEIDADLLDLSVVVPCTPETVVGFRIADEEIKYSHKERMLTCLGRAIRRESDADVFQMRILVDRTSLEIYVDEGRMALSFCVVPEEPRAPLAFFVEGESVQGIDLEAHVLRSAWSEPTRE